MRRASQTPRSSSLEQAGLSAGEESGLGVKAGGCQMMFTKTLGFSRRDGKLTAGRDVMATASLTNIQGGDMVQRSQGPIPPGLGCPGVCPTALSPKTTLQGKRSGNTWSLKLAFCPGRLLKFISLHKVYKYLLRAYYTTMLSTCLAQSKPEIDSCSQTD